MRDLEAHGLEPVERPLTALGAIIPIRWQTAHRLVQFRLQAINAASTGDRVTPPEWLLRNLESLGPGDGVFSPVGCLFPDGHVENYPSVKEAADANKINCEVRLRHWVWTVDHDPQGRLWWDD
jgi:hypothetical protein